MYNKNLPPNNGGKFLYSAKSTLSILQSFSLQRETYQRKKRHVYRSREEQGGQETEADSSDRDIKRLFLCLKLEKYQKFRVLVVVWRLGLARVSGSLSGTSSIHIVTGVPQRDEC